MNVANTIDTLLDRTILLGYGSERGPGFGRAPAVSGGLPSRRSVLSRLRAVR
jgi:hypothetical protein